ncbi:MAG: M13 family metallopeptidase [Bacillota bacterium]|nr:M13 family metallopeptidase [Bacillota bacterium]
MIDYNLIKDDLYEAVNREYLSKVEIPSDRKSIGAFVRIDMEIEKQLLQDFQTLDYEDPYVSEEMVHYLNFYRSIVNGKNKELYAGHPVYAMIEKIRGIQGKDDLNAVLAELREQGLGAIVNSFVHASFQNSDWNILYLDVTDNILPSKEYYLDPASKQRFLTLFRETMLQIFDKFGLEDAESILDAAFSLDEKIVEYVKSSGELADYTKMYNRVSLEELNSYSDLIDLESHIRHFVRVELGELSITQPRFFENMNKLFRLSNLEEIKALILVKFVYRVSDLFGEDLRHLKESYANAILGIKEVKSLEKFAYTKGMQLYSEVVGNYYASKYFGEEAKKDIHDLVHKIIAMYRKRLSENEWLQEETKKNAILKLSTMKLMLGYPDRTQEVYSRIKYDENLTLYENYLNNCKVFQEHGFSKYNQPVDHSIWGMPACMVNAYYNPTSNLICFPAAILNEPFYSLKQSKSANFGGIGAVIAHEISHAFDNNGANFDENGNLKNWWTERDFEAFKGLTEKMIRQFDGLEIYGGTVNGELVVSENLADVGGLACAIACAKEEENCDLAELFINFARIWAFKASEEYMSLLLKTDVHAPTKLRANIQSANMDEFYETFDVKEGDAMFIPKEDRIIVW